MYALDDFAAKACVRFTPVLSEPSAEDAWTGRADFVHYTVLQDFPDLSRFDVYACGSPGLIDAAFLDFTRRAGLPADRFFADAFHNAGTVPLAASVAG